MPYLLNEDKAVKAKLQGLKVTDANAPVGGRPVGVRYRLPEDEIGELTFPLIVIDRSSIAVASDREHRGRVALQYTPESVAEWNPDVEIYETSPYVVDYPVPVDILYQITVLARKEMHLVDLTAKLQQPDRLPYRFGFIEVPEDGTVRSLFIDGGPEFAPTKDGEGKRLFQASFAIRIPTELLPAQIEQAEKVEQVDISLSVATIPST
jgi:hypothetical protein